MSGLSLQFFGVRGSHPAPRPEGSRIGGNTPSVLLELPGAGAAAVPLLLDAGTGIIGAAAELSRAAGPAAERPDELHLFLSHLHWDHVQGLPFFPPLYDPAVVLHVHAARPIDEVQGALALQMREPHFPIGFDQVAANVRFHGLSDTQEFAGAVLQTLPLSHPGGATALRVSAGGRSFVYATDHELGASADIDRDLKRFAAGCDVLVADAHFSPEEKEEHLGWGHSSWRDAAELAQEVQAGTLYLFHHAPEWDDAELDRRVSAARRIHPRTELAAEGLGVHL